MDFTDIRSSIKLPPQLGEPFKKLVVAGMKMLFDKQTNHLLNAALDRPTKDIGQKVGLAVAGVILLLIKKTKKLPSPIILPAAAELMMQVFEYVERSEGIKVDKDDFAKALQIIIQTVTTNVNASMQQGKNQQPGAQPQPQPQQPVPQQPAGMIAQGA